MNGGCLSYDEFEQIIERMKSLIHTTFITPEQAKLYKDHNAEIGKMFLKGEIILDGKTSRRLDIHSDTDKRN